MTVISQYFNFEIFVQVIFSTPSVATDTKCVVFIPLPLKQFKPASQMSCPRVWPFSGTNSIIPSCGPVCSCLSKIVVVSYRKVDCENKKLCEICERNGKLIPAVYIWCVDLALMR